jgi:hypothetical protein
MLWKLIMVAMMVRAVALCFSLTLGGAGQATRR